MDGKIVKFEIVNVDDGNGKQLQERQRALDEGQLKGLSFVLVRSAAACHMLISSTTFLA